MISILEEFAYGNVTPEDQRFEKNSRYGRACALTARIEQELLDKLDGDDSALFQKYVDAQGEVNQLTAVKNLIYGFKLGLTMTAEAFLGIDDLYVSGEE